MLLLQKEVVKTLVYILRQNVTVLIFAKTKNYLIDLGTLSDTEKKAIRDLIDAAKVGDSPADRSSVW